MSKFVLGPPWLAQDLLQAWPNSLMTPMKVSPSKHQTIRGFMWWLINTMCMQLWALCTLRTTDIGSKSHPHHSHIRPIISYKTIHMKTIRAHSKDPYIRQFIMFTTTDLKTHLQELFLWRLIESVGEHPEMPYICPYSMCSDSLHV